MGVATQTMTAMIGALIFASASGCRAMVAGPDLNPIVFIAEAASAISEDLCPDGYDLCDDVTRAKAVPTVLASTVIATLLIGLAFGLLGKLRLTVVIGFIPASVIAGFLSCIGYKVCSQCSYPSPCPGLVLHLRAGVCASAHSLCKAVLPAGAQGKH